MCFTKMKITIYQTMPNNLVHDVMLVAYIQEVRISDGAPTVLIKYF